MSEGNTWGCRGGSPRKGCGDSPSRNRGLRKRSAPFAIFTLLLLSSSSGLRASELTTLDDLRECRKIISVSIKYSWVEDAESRLFSKHHFVFLNGGYEGYAYCMARRKDVHEVKKLDGLSVPPGVMEAVAIILKNSPLRKLEEIPEAKSIQGRSHYEISLELCTEGISFFMTSENRDYQWVVKVADEYYAVGNDAPDSAIKVLEPFMHFELVDNLKESFFGEKKVARRKKGYKLTEAPKPFRNLYFRTAEYYILPEYNMDLFAIVDYLRKNPDREILVSGHCDERGDESYNIALGEKLSSSVISKLINMGANPEKIRSYSHGESRPAAYGHDEDSWRRNRRVEFHFYDYDYALSP